MRQPIDIAEFNTPDVEASRLEALAKQLRENDKGDGQLVKVSVVVRYWPRVEVTP
jgi:hypothetical protein